MIVLVSLISIWKEGEAALKAIFASKLFNDSKRKSHILSQLSDPINKELLVQLRSYLDDYEDDLESVQSLNLNNVPTSTSSKSNSDDVEYNTDEASRSYQVSKPVNSFDTDTNTETEPVSETRNTSEIENEDNLPISSNNSQEEESSKTLSDTSSTKASSEDQTNKSMIESSTNCVDIRRDIQSEIETIKGTLNCQESTSGVNRILVRDNELWIYYNDYVNLNVVMGAVIEKLSVCGFTYLYFNRLARSDNAIVFEIHLVTTETVTSF